jgi:hypothetical protein
MKGKKPVKDLKLSVPAQETPVDRFLWVAPILDLTYSAPISLLKFLWICNGLGCLAAIFFV